MTQSSLTFVFRPDFGRVVKRECETSIPVKDKKPNNKCRHQHYDCQ